MAARGAQRDVKRKQPRMLGPDEKLDTLQPWKSHLYAYFRDDNPWGRYFDPDVTWNTTQENWGFDDIRNEAVPPVVVYTAGAQKLDCENLMFEISNYLPTE